MRRQTLLIALVVGAVLAISPVTSQEARAWRPWPAIWNDDDHPSNYWDKGQVIDVAVSIPADAPTGSSDAINSALERWNDAQRPFCGLQLRRVERLSGDGITIGFEHVADEAELWGNARQERQGLVDLTVYYGFGLDQRGVEALVMHELGHAMGLQHSALSTLMFYEELRAALALVPRTERGSVLNLWFRNPTRDDKAGLKAMWGGCDRDYRCLVTSSVEYVPARDDVYAEGGQLDEAKWKYVYWILHRSNPADPRPSTELSLELPAGTNPSDIEVQELPEGWLSKFYGADEDGAPLVVEHSLLDSTFDDVGRSLPVLHFWTEDPRYGSPVDGTGIKFVVTSTLGPMDGRAFTNSQRFDSFQSTVDIPGDRIHRAPSPTPTNTLLPTFTPRPTFTPHPTFTTEPTFTPDVTPTSEYGAVEVYIPAALRNASLLDPTSRSTAPVVATAQPTETATSLPTAAPTDEDVLQPENVDDWHEVRRFNMPNWIETIDVQGNVGVWGGAGNVWVYDLRTDRLMHVLTSHERYVHSASFRPGGGQLLTGGADPGGARVRAWDWRAGAEVWSQVVADDPWGVNLQVSSDGKTLVTEAARVIQLWELRSDGIAPSVRLGWGGGPTISSRGQVAYWNDALRVVGFDGHEIHRFAADTSDGFGGPITFNRSGDKLFAVDAANTVLGWSLPSGDLLAPVKGYSDTVLNLTIHPGDRLLAASTADGAVHLWSMESHELLRTISGVCDLPKSLSFDRDGASLAIGCQNGAISMWGLDR